MPVVRYRIGSPTDDTFVSYAPSLDCEVVAQKTVVYDRAKTDVINREITKITDLNAVKIDVAPPDEALFSESGS